MGLPGEGYNIMLSMLSDSHSCPAKRRKWQNLASDENTVFRTGTISVALSQLKCSAPSWSGLNSFNASVEFDPCLQTQTWIEDDGGT
jgi:hypothetical protein